MRFVKNHHFLFACSFFFCLGGSVLSFTLVYHLTDLLSFSPKQIGAYLASGSLFYFIGTNLYLRFGSKLDPARVFPVAAIIAFFTSIPLGFLRLPALLYFSYWLLQLATSFFWPPILAYLTDTLAGKELNKRISQYSRSWMASIIIGPPVAGALYRWNNMANFILIYLSYFLAVLCLLVLRRFAKRSYGGEGKSGNPVQEAEQHNSGDKEYKPVIAALEKKLDLFRYRGWIGIFCTGICMNILGSIVPLHIRDGLGFTESSAGMLLFFRCTASFIGFAILARFTAWHFKNWWFIFTQAGLTLCTVLLLFAGSRLYFFFFVAVLFGLVNSGCHVTSVFYSGATGKNTKKNVTCHEIFMSIGGALGSAGGGFFYHHFRFIGLSLAQMFVLLTGLAAFIILGRRERSLFKGGES